MRGTFIVKKGPTGKFRFQLVAADGEIVVTSGAYMSKDACLRSVEALRQLAAEAALEDRTGRTAARK